MPKRKRKTSPFDRRTEVYLVHDAVSGEARIRVTGTPLLPDPKQSQLHIPEAITLRNQIDQAIAEATGGKGE